MGCVLRLAGEEFEVDRFLETTEVHPCASWHKDELQRRSRPPAKENGCNVSISNADDLEQQCIDAMEFLTHNANWLSNLLAVWKVVDPVIDFSAHMAPENIYARSYRFPSKLLTLAAEFGISIELSTYRVSDSAS